MTLRTMLGLGAVLTLGAACEGRTGSDSQEPPEQAAAPSAEGKAEEGRVTIKGPGVDIAVSIPETIRDRAQVDSGNGLIPPGVSLSGMHIQGGDEEAGSGQGSVEIRFTSDRAPGELVSWYRDPARGERFTIDSIREQGGAQHIAGTLRESGGRFSVQLAPRGRGTDGRLAIADSN